MKARLYEDVKIDFVEGGESDEAFSLEDYREVVVVGIAVDGSSNKLTVSNLSGVDVELCGDADDEAEGVAITASQLADDEHEIKVTTEANVRGVVLRGNSRYRAVEDTDDILDDFEVYDG